MEEEEILYDWDYYTNNGEYDLGSLPAGFIITKTFINLFFRRCQQMTQLIRSDSFPGWNLDEVPALDNPLTDIDYSRTEGTSIGSKVGTMNANLKFMLGTVIFYKESTWTSMGSVVDQTGMIYDVATDPTRTHGGYFTLDVWSEQDKIDLLTPDGYDMIQNFNNGVWYTALYWSAVYKCMHTIMRYFSMPNSNTDSLLTPSITRGAQRSYSDSAPIAIGSFASEFSTALGIASANNTTTTTSPSGIWTPFSWDCAYVKSEASFIPPATMGEATSSYSVERGNHNEAYIKTAYPLKIRVSASLNRGNETHEKIYDELDLDQDIDVNFFGSSAQITRTTTYLAGGGGITIIYTGGTEAEFSYIMNGVYEFTGTPIEPAPMLSEDLKCELNLSSIFAAEGWASGFPISADRKWSMNTRGGSSQIKLIIVEMPNESFDTPMTY